MAFSEKEYFEKTGNMQQKLHESEKKRLELEKQLFAYSRSDERINQIKSAQLHCYLKQICEREKRARIRNREFLKDFDRIESHIRIMATHNNTLHQTKVAYENRIQKRSSFWKNDTELREQKGARTDQGKQLPGPSLACLGTDLAEGLYQPATIFMGRQSCSFSSSASKPFQPMEHFHSPPLPSPEEKEKHISAKKNEAALKTRRGSSTTENSRSSECSARINSPEYRAVFQSGISTAVEGRCTNIIPEEMHRNEPPLSSTSPSPIILSRSGSSLNMHNDPALEQKQKSIPHSQNHSILHNVDDNTADTTSDLTISLSEDEEQEGPPEDEGHMALLGEKAGTPESAELTRCNKEPSLVPQQRGSTSLVQASDQQDAADTSLTNLTAEESCLSVEEFFHLLKSIERRLNQTNLGSFELYQSSTVSKRKLNDIISLCHRKGSLSGEDLEACGAVVLHQLQKLSRSTSKGCLLPEEILGNNWTDVDESKLRSCLPSDSVILWDCLYKHAVILEDLHILARDEISEIFAPLLVAENSKNINKATALLKAILPEAAEGSLSIQSNESSCSLPSILNDSGEIKQAKPAQWLYSTVLGKQGLQSGEEDDKEESLAESVPIREMKAYQLLKQSAVQQRGQHSEEEDDVSELELSGIKNERNMSAGKEENLDSKTSTSLSQESPQSRGLRAEIGSKMTCCLSPPLRMWANRN
ncbi:centrosomal protein kizuna isoform X2 [Polyodon spathula]|uniref:centrosomal protein kizuna isoform X2 n=1 Tax=Polyodon spathula TaxID=7913 RepID=UPI001B7E5AE4|nr:centrosomal protein kizuna isoform X2 [Polyodon spathula]